MDTHYTTGHVTELFGISHETVKNWTTEFKEFLSPTATPEAGKKRLFTDADMRVFALVAEYKKRGLKFADAHAALATGQRGDVPTISSLDRLPTVVQDMVLRLRSEMDALRRELETEKGNTHKALGKVELLEQQLEKRERELQAQFRLLARYEAKYGKLDE